MNALTVMYYMQRIEINNLFGLKVLNKYQSLCRYYEQDF